MTSWESGKTQTVSPSIELGPGRYWRLYHYENGEKYCVTLQRLVAYAHGELDHIRFEEDPREVHHKDEDPWNNSPENLEAVEIAEHNAIHKRLPHE